MPEKQGLYGQNIRRVHPLSELMFIQSECSRPSTRKTKHSEVLFYLILSAFILSMDEGFFKNLGFITFYLIASEKYRVESEN